MKAAGAGASLEGFCVLCARRVRFSLQGANPDGSLREALACDRCGCIARQRAVAGLLFDAVADAHARVYLTEQASRLYLALAKRLPRITGSEWTASWWQRLRLCSWLWRHRMLRKVRHEDVTALAFATASFDVVVSLDVLEHVPDFRAALREFARVLRPGGLLLLCVPYDPGLEGVRTCALRDAAGRITHLVPPEYHGDPLGGGVLCFHKFGRGLADEARAAGFAVAEAIAFEDAAAGVPQPVWVLRASA
ncbi:MAG: class I SAM-dependent methyltransferase [Luteimonas sp.]